MRLYIFRHGHSLRMDEARVQKDQERPLSDKGREESRLMAGVLAKKEPRPSVILTSPLKRARQTAEEILPVLKPASGIKVFDPLSNIVPASELYDDLKKELGSFPEMVIIGHQPQLGDLIVLLSGKSLELKTAGVAAFNIEDGFEASLLWNKNP